MSPNSPVPAKSRPFPWLCPACGRTEVYRQTVPYTIQVKHDGVLHQIDIPQLQTPKCRNCGEMWFDNDVSDQIDDALRAKLHLLFPTEINERRLAMGLTPEELSRRLGFAADTVERVEERLLIQSRMQDNLLHLYFAFPAVREAVNGLVPDARLGLPSAVSEERSLTGAMG